jgi:hypothetical protein
MASAHRSAVHHRRRARAAGRGAAGAHRRDAVHGGAEHRDQTVGRRRVSRRAGADSRRCRSCRRRSTLTNVAVQNWRRAPTVSCSPARGAASRSPSSCSGREVFSPHDLADLEAEARLLGQLLHKNIVRAFEASRVEPTRCCLVTELAPFGSLKSVLDRVGEREARAAVCLSAAPPLTCIHRRSCTGTSKPANLLVFSLSSSETVVAKLTDLRAQRASPTANQQGRHHADGVERQVRPRRHADQHGAGAVRSAARARTEATDMHALRHDLSSRTPRSRSRGTLRKPSSPASGPSGPRIGACPIDIGSLRSFAACGRQTPPLAHRAGRCAGARRATMHMPTMTATATTAAPSTRSFASCRCAGATTARTRRRE